MKHYEWTIRFEDGTEESGQLYSHDEQHVRNFIAANCPKNAKLVSVKEVN